MTSSVAMVDVRQRLSGREWQPAGKIYAVDGTSYPGAPFPPTPLLSNGEGFWSGFATGIVGGLSNVADGLWDSWCCGYPALTIPMWPSVQTGRTLTTQQIWDDQTAYHKQHGTYFPWCMSGYSQGAMVTDQIYTEDTLADDGLLNPCLPWLYRIYNFGDPFRCPGIANGNTLLSNLPLPANQDGQVTGGIGGPLDLTEEQTNREAPDGKPIVMSCANYGDLYTGCPTGENPWTGESAQGKTGYLFFRIVMQPSFLDVVEAAEVLEHPIASIEEAVNAGTFFAAGLSAPHYEYFPQMLGCINDALSLGLSLPHVI
jgi:hypothetical protein